MSELGSFTIEWAGGVSTTKDSGLDLQDIDHIEAILKQHRTALVKFLANKKRTLARSARRDRKQGETIDGNIIERP